MNYTLTANYALKWQLSFAANYQFTQDNICINTTTNRRIRQVLNGRCKGYCIKGRFYSLTYLRKYLEPIQNIDCPF